MNIISKLVSVAIIAFSLAGASSSAAGTGDLNLDFAESLYMERDYYRAISEYKRYIFLNAGGKNVPFARFRIGLCYMGGDKYFEASNVLVKIWDDFPMSPYSIAGTYHAGISYLKGGAAEFAIANFKKLAMDESQGRTFYEASRFLIGYSHLEMNNWKKTREEMSAFSKDFPSSPLSKNSENIVKKIDGMNDLPRKSPVLAGVLAIVPGLGHLYDERELDALQSFIMNGVFGYLTYYSYYSEQRYGGDHKNFTPTFVLGGITALFYSANIFGAVNSARNANAIIRGNYINGMRNDNRDALETLYNLETKEPPK